MFRFYSERGKLSEAQLQKVQEIQQRWKAGCVYWLTHDNQEIEIPEWVAVNVVVNNKQNLVRGSRICMSLNHTKGYGCNRLADGMCSYVHECALCGSVDHGVFQKRANGLWTCTKLRRWYDEEGRYKAAGFGDPRKHEDVLTDIAKQPREARASARKSSQQGTSPKTNAWASPATGARPTTASTSASSSPAPSASVSPALPGQPTPASKDKNIATEMLPEAAISPADAPTAAPASRRSGRKAGGAKSGAGATTNGGRSGPTAVSVAASSLPAHKESGSTGPARGQGVTVADAAAGLEAAAAPERSRASVVEEAVQTRPAALQATFTAAAATASTKLEGVVERRAWSLLLLAPPDESDDVGSAALTDEFESADLAEAAHDEAAVAKTSELFTKNGRPIKEGRFVCTQHWKPQPGIDPGLAVCQGELLTVTWTDGLQGGWAYGHVVDDHTQVGYFPQAVLAEPRRPPCRRDVDEICMVMEDFQAPEDVGGYLKVEPGHTVKVLHEGSSAWVYAELIAPSNDGQAQVGWLPEIFLAGQDEGARQC
eukprot:CAMPEP_0170227810 /NCGR_PEP_ID=MMETSP0116_2-20130129/13621_1 /TAXON_ID=400756 /ORGANISM="Durinskia baltica, Strain CSIRO CS-38" /LENGTH=541 /DNA_ID=CAMNT_0010478545 /DNA_START=42 /DNA_END=1667 /DNA_ORIENTATION=+